MYKVEKGVLINEHSIATVLLVKSTLSYVVALQNLHHILKQF